jgi:hypothetical protein
VPGKVISLQAERQRRARCVNLSDHNEADVMLGLLALTLCGDPKHDAERINSFCDELSFDVRAVYRNFLYRNVFAGLNDWTN